MIREEINCIPVQRRQETAELDEQHKYNLCVCVNLKWVLKPESERVECKNVLEVMQPEAGFPQDMKK